MQQTIELRSESITYTLRTSRRAKRLRLSVHLGGRVVVTRPWGLSKSVVQRFIIQHADWVVGKIRAATDATKRRESIPRVRFADHKRQALDFVHARVAHWNRHYNAPFAGIRVRNQKTRWGSCSSKRTLSFNFKILFLPQHLADYIIVHELCHLQELNHSPAFWRLVERTTPYHHQLRRELRCVLIS